VPRTPLDRYDGREFDVLVLGAGITGGAVARELVRRGWSVAVVERRDPGWGTSGRSTRLVHGGLRYLAGGRVGLVRAALAARLELAREAPHLVRPVPFLLPAPGSGAGMTARFLPLFERLYDLLARPRRGWPPPREIERDQAVLLVPGLSPGLLPERVRIFYDGVTDDRRLTVLTAVAAAREGAVLLTRTEVVRVEAAGDRRARVTVRDGLTGELARSRVRAIVSATGPWADATRRQLGLPARGPLLRPTRGSHLLWPARAEGGAVLVHPADGRVLLAVPTEGGLLLGTTDVDDDRAPDEILPPEEDLRYLAIAAGRLLPELPVPPRAAFAGLRPLLAGPGHPDRLSRRARVVVERLEGIPVLHLVGGKLTLHRPMARRLATHLAREIGPPPAGERPPGLLPGSPVATAAGETAAARAAGLDPVQATWLVRRFGTLWRQVVETPMSGDPRRPLGEGAVPLAGELVHAVREEGARTLADVLARLRLPEIARNGDDEEEMALSALALLGGELGWGPGRRERELERWQRERDRTWIAPPLFPEAG